MTNPPHTLISNGPEKGINLHGWTITTCKTAIFNCGELERASQELAVPNPEMLFGNNHLTIAHESGLKITFKAMDALQRVDASPNAAEGIKVACAVHWAKNNAEAAEKIKDVIKPYDWTYTTDYTGTVESAAQPFQTTRDTINIEQLKRPDPILFYDELVLYEDELADNGTAMLSLRVRVMPTCFLILLRFFLRVDDVLFRVNDTRLYHEFGTNHLVREYTSRDEEYSRIRGVSSLPVATGRQN
ncbi:TIP41-like family-domain-containing protein [Powellomyces hirtus]|nr:TIP41-like family-domain-containing protein [Powellomyces hirtus]